MQPIYEIDQVIWLIILGLKLQTNSSLALTIERQSKTCKRNLESKLVDFAWRINAIL